MPSQHKVERAVTAPRAGAVTGVELTAVALEGAAVVDRELVAVPCLAGAFDCSRGVDCDVGVVGVSRRRRREEEGQEDGEGGGRSAGR